MWNAASKRHEAASKKWKLMLPMTDLQYGCNVAVVVTVVVVLTVVVVATVVVVITVVVVATVVVVITVVVVATVVVIFTVVVVVFAVVVSTFVDVTVVVFFLYMPLIFCLLFLKSCFEVDNVLLL